MNRRKKNLLCVVSLALFYLTLSVSIYGIESDTLSFSPTELWFYLFDVQKYASEKGTIEIQFKRSPRPFQYKFLIQKTETASYDARIKEVYTPRQFSIKYFSEDGKLLREFHELIPHVEIESVECTSSNGVEQLRIKVRESIKNKYDLMISDRKEYSIRLTPDANGQVTAKAKNPLDKNPRIPEYLTRNNPQSPFVAVDLVQRFSENWLNDQNINLFPGWSISYFPMRVCCNTVTPYLIVSPRWDKKTQTESTQSIQTPALNVEILIQKGYKIVFSNISPTIRLLSVDTDIHNDSVSQKITWGCGLTLENENFFGFSYTFFYQRKLKTADVIFDKVTHDKHKNESPMRKEQE